LGLDNPTPAMLQQKRKSLGRTKAAELAKGATVKNTVKNGPSSSRASTRGQKRSAPEPSPLASPSGSSQQQMTKKAKINKAAASKKVVQKQQQSFAGVDNSHAHLIVADPLSLSLAGLKEEVPNFQGANLVVLHTPATWEPPQVFNAVRVVREINKSAGLTTFLVLVGCGLSNAHMLREALIRQTSRVQLVVFENKTASEEDSFRLRETTSLFLLGYFFPGCETIGSCPKERMVSHFLYKYIYLLLQSKLAIRQKLVSTEWFLIVSLVPL